MAPSHYSQDAEMGATYDHLEAQSPTTPLTDSGSQGSRMQRLFEAIHLLAISKKLRRVRPSRLWNSTPDITPKRQIWLKRATFVFVIILVSVGVLVLIWFSFTLALLQRLSPPVIHNGLQKITSGWTDTTSPLDLLDPWPEDFSQDIVPIPCHSHNDYTRHIPLYDALEAGCTGVEADIWLQDNDLYVGHTKSSLTSARTLQSLYIDPLVQILENQNNNHTCNGTGCTSTYNGVFQISPNTTLTLLLDVKTDGLTTWPIAMEQLAPLRDRGLLTYFNGTDVVHGPVIVVGTGNTPFSLIISNTTYRDAFFDAPLNNLADSCNSTNSYYASVSLSQAIGKTWFGKLSTNQWNLIESQIAVANGKGLKSRYWDLPAWPISARDHIWSGLVAREVGMLNVDDLVSAARWNWDWCTILGFSLC